MNEVHKFQVSSFKFQISNFKSVWLHFPHGILRFFGQSNHSKAMALKPLYFGQSNQFSISHTYKYTTISTIIPLLVYYVPSRNDHNIFLSYSNIMILCNSGIATALLSILALIPLGVVGLASFTFFLAIITRLRQIIIRSLSSSAGKDDISSNGNTALYTGRVSHTRYKPVLHSFSYPLFFCLLDLSEIEAFRSQLWPLNMLMAFREEDHLKNGEGLSKDEKDTNIIESRIRRLVSQRTGGKCYPAPGKTIFVSFQTQQKNNIVHDSLITVTYIISHSCTSKIRKFSS